MRAVYALLIPALWAAWIAGWCMAALVSKPVRRRESVVSRLTHLVPLGIGAALLAWPRSGRPIPDQLLFSRTATGFWLGTVLLVAGLGVTIAARVHLGGNWSGTVTLKHDHTLTLGGPYRWVRHPIYSGLLLAVLGSAVAGAEWRAFVGAGLITAAFLRKIRIEERFLAEQFGPAYDRYRQEVAALIPGVI